VLVRVGLSVVRRRKAVPLMAGVAAFVSVPASALGFVGLYAVGGSAPIPLDTLTSAMLAVHVVIGLAEAAISYLTVAALLKVRPDLVYAARGLAA
jgi:cobalt/nickel transport system permease protein